MIKKILVALDTDSDTPIATQYAVEMARRHEASITGLAVIDMGNIESGSRGGGIGSMYYAEKLREKLTQETREKAQALIADFEEAVGKTDVPYQVTMREGVPFRRIVEDAKYHDLLVVGKDPHFFYGRPKKRTETLAKVVKSMLAPTLIVGDTYVAVNRVLVAYDASAASARAMRRFAQMAPFSTDVHVEIVNVHSNNADRAESELMLQHASEFMAAHGFKAQMVSLQAPSGKERVVEYVRQYNADLVVAGAHSVSKIQKMAFGSTTAALLDQCPGPLFLDH